MVNRRTLLASFLALPWISRLRRKPLETYTIFSNCYGKSAPLSTPELDEAFRRVFAINPYFATEAFPIVPVKESDKRVYHMPAFGPGDEVTRIPILLPADLKESTDPLPDEESDELSDW